MFFRTIKAIHFSAEIMTFAIASVFMYITITQINSAVLQSFAQDTERDIKNIDLYLENYFEEQKTTFSKFIDIPHKESAAQVFSALRDVYELSSSFKITKFYKKDEASILFVGFSYEKSPLSVFLKTVSNNDIALSSIFRSPENDVVSIHLVYHDDDKYIIGTIDLNNLMASIQSILSSTDSLFFLASKEGFIYSSSVNSRTNENILTVLQTTSMLPEKNSSKDIFGPSYFYTLTESNYLDASIAILRSSPSSSEIVNVILISYPIFMIMLFLLSTMKTVIEQVFIIKPLMKINSLLSDWNVLDETPLFVSLKYMPQDFQNLYTEFQKAKSRAYDVVHELANTKKELVVLNAELELRVKDRTHEYERANTELQKTNQNLESTLSDLTKARDILLAQEKMAALGRLSAGVAHELNTPLSAVLSGTSFAENSIMEVCRTIEVFILSLSENELILFKELKTKAIDSVQVDTIEMRLRAKKIKEKCIQLNSINPRTTADYLSELMINPEDTLIDRLLYAERCDELIKFAYSLTSIIRAIRIARIASENAAKVVQALKNYSWDEKASFNIIDLNHELQTVMTLFENKTKKSVNVIMNLTDNIMVKGNADRLNQVFINIITNALQAMHYQGTLELNTRIEQDEAIIAISDSGPGIPEEVRNKVFTPFFTTKPKGEGTGLGLDISKRFIETMDGTISFTCENNHTIFIIRLPLFKDSNTVKD